MRNIKKQMNTFFDEDTYKLNKYIEQTKLLDENGVILTGEYSSEDEKEENLKKKDKVLSNVPMNINTAHIWEASKEGYVKNGAKISKTESGYEVEFQDGDMKALTNSPIKIYTSESIKCDEIDTVNNIETPSIFDYSWKVNQNGTITIYTFPSDTKEDDMDSYFTTTLMPESMSFKAAADDYYVSGWNKWSGSISYCQMLGINWSKYSSWLYTHSKYYYSIHKDENLYKYYLGTPYGSGYLVGGAYPHGDCLPDYEGMNCTAFVWHVLWKAMASSGNGNTPAAYGLGIDRDSTFKGWTTQPVNNDVKHAYFKNKKSLIKDGKPRRGDIIWVMGAGEYEIGTDDIDNHILFYWGNGTNDVGWHSTHKTTRNTETSHSSWCDGTFDPEKGAHKVMTNGNCQTEIASKQPTTFGYILYRAGTSSTGFPQLIDIKKVNKNTGEWDDRLKGTKFTLYRYNTKKEKWVKKETITIESAAAVQFKTECQPGNKYKIVETTVTEGFTKAPDIIVDVSKSNSAMVKSLTVENVEGPSPTPPDGTVTPEISEEPDEPDDTPTPEPPQIYVTKHSTASWDIIENNNEYSVGGASFGIYSDANCTQEIGTVTTGNNGISNPLQLPCVDTGNYTYYVKEKYAPKGHNLNTEVKSLTVTMPNDGGRWFNVDFWDAAKFSHIQIKKVSGDGTWNDSLKGTEFKLYYGDSELETLTIQNGEFHAFQYNCLLGKTYTIKETKTMPGKVKMKDILVTINNEISYQGTYWITATNVDAPKLQITKQSTASQDILDLSAYTVGGAEFGVYEDQACTKKVPGGTLTTKENGVTDTLTLPCNVDGTYTYWVREDGAPNGHKENKTPQLITVTLPTDAGTTKQMTFTNEPETTNLAAFTQKLDSKGQAVQNVVFKVRLYDGKYTTVQECEAKGVLKKTWYLKSGEDGLVKFDDKHLARDYHTSDSFYRYDKDGDGDAEVAIPIGCTVTYQEVKTPAQYTVDDTVKLWETEESNKEINIKPVRLYNKPTPCKISINKYREDGKTPLQGVEFELTFIKESESYTELADPTWSPRLKQGDTAKATTDASGNIVWDNLDQGEYQIVETKTVSGMTLLTKPINITLPITMSDQEAKAMSAATDQGKYDSYTNKWFFYEATFDVTNNVTFKMPTTGATGVWKFIFFGFGTMAVLGTGLILYDSKNKKPRKRKRK